MAQPRRRTSAPLSSTGLGSTIPYMHNSEHHEYTSDYLVRLRQDRQELGTLVLETKGYDSLLEVKAATVRRWVAALSNDGHGRWHYAVASDLEKTGVAVSEAVEVLTGLTTTGQAMASASTDGANGTTFGQDG